MTWREFLRPEECCRLPLARVVHGLPSGAANSWDEEPDAFDTHVRVCWRAWVSDQKGLPGRSLPQSALSCPRARRAIATSPSGFPICTR
jgi:hypothetical protein